MFDIFVYKLVGSVVQKVDCLGKPFFLRGEILRSPRLGLVGGETPTGDEMFEEDEADLMIRIVGLAVVVLYTGHHALYKSPPFEGKQGN